MKSTQLVVSLGVLAALVAAPAVAGDHRHGDRGGHAHAEAHRAYAADTAVREVANAAAQDEPGYGWRYFADPATHYAVVISPQGDYYLSRGKGLSWTAVAQKTA